MDAPRSPEESLRAGGATHHMANGKASGPGPGTGRRLKGDAETKPNGRTNRLRLLRVGDAMAAVLRVYLLRGLLGAGELSLWWGAPKTGKSFLLLRLAYGLALGLGMWGREAKPCAVLYVVAEGANGINGRIQALAEKMGEAHRFAYVAQRVDLLNSGECRDDIIAHGLALLDECERRDGGRPHLMVVVDTYHRAAPGAEENSARDAGRFVANIDAIREGTGAHVAVVHHGGASGERPRGSTALVAAADLVVKVSGQGEARVATVEDAKDDESGAVLPFRLRRVPLPSVDCEERWTCAAEEADAAAGPAKAERGAKLHEEAELLLRYLRDFFAEGKASTGRPKPGMPAVPMASKKVLFPFLIENGWLRLSERLSGDGKRSECVPDAEYTRLWKRLKALELRGLAGSDKDHVWLARSAP